MLNFKDMKTGAILEFQGPHRKVSLLLLSDLNPVYNTTSYMADVFWLGEYWHKEKGFMLLEKEYWKKLC